MKHPYYNYKRFTGRQGFTLIETLIGLAILLIVLTAVWALFHAGVNAIGSARAKTTAVAVANEYIEIVRNLSYQDVGTVAGWPIGVLNQTTSSDRNGFTFTITTQVRYVDDPFDGNAFGTIPGKPTDTQPSDYKLVEVSVCWSRYPCPTPMRLTTSVVPKGIENSPNTGTLALQVLDAGGSPVRDAAVHVINATTIPTIDIVNTTDVAGNLLLPSLPPAQDTYHIDIAKAGYSDDFTLAPSPQNPNPTKPDTSVVAEQVTPLTFFIDEVSEITLATVDAACAALPDVSFNLHGDYLDGNSPDVYRYSADLTTDGSGQLTRSDIRWDNYHLSIDPAENVDVSGTTINQPFNILPGSDQVVYIHLVPNEANSLLASVRESGSGTPISGATVHLEDGLGYDETKTTGQGTVTQTDWGGGSGQSEFIDPTRYATQDGNLDTTDGQLTLASDQSLGSFSEDFSSDLYADIAQTTADWDSLSGEARLHNNGATFDSPGTVQSLSINSDPGIIMSATLTAAEQLNGQSINYALSADGGVNFEPAQPGQAHTFTVSGTDLRWRATLETTDPIQTPSITEIQINYLRQAFRASGELVSSTIDVGVNSNFDSLIWSPATQPAPTGDPSVRFQIATNTDNLTWNFVGPDGTAASYYTISGDTLWSGHSTDRYFRYRVIITTADVALSPVIASVSLVHSASCLPPGQSFFSPLDPGAYQLTVDRPGYLTYIQTYDLSGDQIVYIDLEPS